MEIKSTNGSMSPLGKFGYFLIPVGIGIVIVVESFWPAVGIGAAIGGAVANVKAILLVGRVQQLESDNPLLKLEAKLSGVNASRRIRFIFMQSLVGMIVAGGWTALIAGVATFFR